MRNDAGGGGGAGLRLCWRVNGAAVGVPPGASDGAKFKQSLQKS
ncbi:MAG TPA: hypothetical protein VK794_12480 [Steroidobacteraceae bacterium]|nr:hypothetical protein [Steroidobacteraceae bacterium]